MKRLSTVFLVFAMAMSFNACKHIPDLPDLPIEGTGHVVTREIPIEDYSIIIIDRPIELHYKQSNEPPYLKITADSNLIEAINPRVEHDRLILSVVWSHTSYGSSEIFRPTKCVVETNSKHFYGIGTNLIKLGSLSYCLRKMPEVDTTIKRALDTWVKDESGRPAEGSAKGVILAMKKSTSSGMPITIDIVYDTITTYEEYRSRKEEEWYSGGSYRSSYYDEYEVLDVDDVIEDTNFYFDEVVEEGDAAVEG